MTTRVSRTTTTATRNKQAGKDNTVKMEVAPAPVPAPVSAPVPPPSSVPPSVPLSSTPPSSVPSSSTPVVESTPSDASASVSEHEAKKVPRRRGRRKATVSSSSEDQTVEAPLDAPRVSADVELETHGNAPVSEEGEQPLSSQNRTKRVVLLPDVLAMVDELLKSNEAEQNQLKDRNKTLRAQAHSLKDVRRFLVRPNQDSHRRTTANKASVTRNPTGFAKPRGISPEMYNYLINHAGIRQISITRNNEPETTLEITPDCKLARNELTKALCAHFKNNDMRKHPTDKRRIYLDQETCKLFRIDPSTFPADRLSENGEPIITYFELQKYLPAHCVKENE